MNCGSTTTPAEISCLATIIGGALRAGLLFIIPVTIILIIIAGYKFVMSRGDSKQLEGARKTLTFAIIGFTVVMLSFFMMNIIYWVTGVKCLRTDNLFNTNFLTLCR